MKAFQKLFLASLMLFPCLAEAQLMLPASYNAYPMVLETPTGFIHGTITIPSSGKATSIVLMIAGSGPTDRDGNNAQMKNNALKMTAEYLAEVGVASLRFDKRGIGASKTAMSKEDSIRFDHYIDDAVAWIHLLKSDKRFSKIIVLGHSEGSLIGMIAAKKANADAFISVAGAGDPADEILMRQLDKQSPAIKEMAVPIIEFLKKGQTIKDVPPLLSALFRPSVQPYLISWFRYDPSIEIKKLQVPVLIVQGTTDIQVEVADANRLHQSAEKSILKLVEGMNHILKSAPANRTLNVQTYNQPDLALHAEFGQGLIEFIRSL